MVGGGGGGGRVLQRRSLSDVCVGENAFHFV